MPAFFSMPSRIVVLLFTAAALLTAGCDDLLGSKSDATTEEIFEEGRIDPTLVEDVGYVPLIPFFEQGFGGPLQAPTDVYVGYDEFIYVVDARGLHVLDLAGRPQFLFPLEGATAVTQDRRFHVYVAARRDTVVNGQTWNLPVIYRISGLTTGNPTTEDLIWHPFDDDSRKFNRPDPIDTDQDVAFTGVTVLADNRIRVSRRGPVNLLNSPILPHNAIMEFSPEGVNTQTITLLNPVRPSLRSAVNPSDVLSFIHPPQRSFDTNLNFFVAQTPIDEPLQYAVLSIQAVETSDGITYRPDNQRIVAAVENDPEKGDGFLYEPYKFTSPSDLAYAADETNYLFVLDDGKDSLFVFTANGIEGVAPPPGSPSPKPVVVSFGGTGAGALQFNNPQGVAYFRRIVYVADTGNNRISRFRLNTDFE
ncbi:hypothetical protein AWN76_002000 [Rhodothermaceae bacterium RA]|nr:hypothetical protein AWN76_002000 [Rhodothermaceae bacterium RA]